MKGDKTQELSLGQGRVKQCGKHVISAQDELLKGELRTRIVVRKKWLGFDCLFLFWGFFLPSG